jgi:hypothetical protein
LAIRSLGIEFDRTIRAVGWTNEENGGRGAEQCMFVVVVVVVVVIMTLIDRCYRSCE